MATQKRKKVRSAAKARKRPVAKRRPAKTITYRQQLIKVAVGLGTLICLVICAALLTEHLMIRKAHVPLPPVPSGPSPSPESEHTGVVHPPVKEPSTVLNVPPKLEPLPVPPPLVEPPAPLPKVAIIIDDVGQDRRIVNQFLSLEMNLTFSILPFSPHNEQLSHAIHQAGHEIMLHLPMEPKGYPQIDPGPGVLLDIMTPDEMRAQLVRDLDAVPFAKGVNNHMGSYLTTQSSRMHQIFSSLKQKDLFFVDSRTTSRTVCQAAAALLKVPFAERDVFIDHYPDRPRITSQLHELVRVACKNGQAIGIGHPRRLTYEVLKDQKEYLGQRVKIVPASDLVKIIE